ncbi:MAG: hypothetical protein A3E84_05820 [Gammaproteobacteria bacterium RIFCSPHIGHO2_12_FULL_42_13]|nr:MAG: hypothetical protein A3E84_05820 [Gammaproteobacteria bacterium RIFCSPHIGHO2_12_FULL_42_13]
MKAAVKLLKKYFIFIKIIAALLIFWLLAHSSQLNVSLFSSLLNKPFFTLAIVGLFYLAVLANTWRWYRLNAAQEIALPLTKTLIPTYLTVAFNTILPGSVGGDVFRTYHLIKKFPQQKSGVILSIFLDRFSGLMGIFLIICLTALYRWDAISQNHTLAYVLTVCFSLCAMGGIVFFISILLPDNLGLTHWLEKKFSGNRWVQPVVSLLEAMHVYRHSKLIILECLIVSLITQLALLAAILLINNMMGLAMLSPFDYMLALAIAQIANLIPLTPGGIGIGEAAFANILLILNPSITGAYATVYFASRLISVMAYLPGVLLGIFGSKILHKETYLPRA